MKIHRFIFLNEVLDDVDADVIANGYYEAYEDTDSPGSDAFLHIDRLSDLIGDIDDHNFNVIGKRLISMMHRGRVDYLVISAIS